jgi:glycosyltransferase involved in cell wall biosynthesis
LTSAKPKISVIVCTYNRAKLLSTALSSLEEQALDESRYEVLVINNNSTDGTQELALEFVARHRNFSVIVENSQGLSHARNRGWKEAKGEYVAYIDDDCKPPPQWLTVGFNTINNHEADVFGGPYYPFYVSNKPRWWKDSYRTREHAEKARFLRTNEKLSGGNIFFRRSLLETSPGFNSGLGMSGKRIGLGEEDALLMYLHGAKPGLRVYYEPTLFVYHLVHPNKMTLKWAIRKRFAEGRYAEKLRIPPPFSRNERINVWTEALVASLKIGIGTVRAFLTRDRRLYPLPQNYLYERVFQHVKKLGILYECGSALTVRTRTRKDFSKNGQLIGYLTKNQLRDGS